MSENKMKIILAYILFFVCINTYADTFDISKFKTTNELIWDKEFNKYLSVYFGENKEYYFYKNATVREQIKEGLGGPPEIVKEIEKNIFIASACRFQSCSEKAAIIVDLKNKYTVFGIIGYQCKIEKLFKLCEKGKLVIFYRNRNSKDALSKYLIIWKNKYAPKAKIIYKIIGYLKSTEKTSLSTSHT